MKVLFDCQMPFQLAHGGGQIQIEQTARGLLEAGVEVDHLHWWDDRQTSDILHFFARPHTLYAQLVKKNGRKLVISELLTGPSSWGPLRRLPNALFCRANRLLGNRFDRRFSWDSYKLADAILALTPWEQRLLTELYDAPPEKVIVVPNGVEKEFFEQPPAPGGREDFLVCTATIAERKRVVELAEAAVAANVPVWIVGKPYSEIDAYYRRFLALHKKHPGLVRYEGPVSSRAELAGIYQRARGFVLLSTMESLSLSALEAAACGCPLLLSDLPWARCTFDDKASYCPITVPASQASRHLEAFHRLAPALPVPPRPKTWREVAEQIKAIYERIL